MYKEAGLSKTIDEPAKLKRKLSVRRIDLKIAEISIWVVVEFFCLFVFLRDIKKREKYMRDDCSTGVVKNVEIKKEALIMLAYCLLASISAYYVCYRITSINNVVKILIGFVGLSAASIIDYRIKLIPNYLVAIMLVSRIVIMPFEFIFLRGEFEALFLDSFISAILVFAVLFILSIVSKGGIGMGDVKILTSIGFLCGVYMVVNTVLVALLLCVLVASSLLIMKKKKVTDKIPFGPFLFAGYIVTIMLGAY